MSIVFPASVDELTPKVLSAALAKRRPGVVVRDFTVVSVKQAGEGVASTADRVVLDLQYDADPPPDLPTRLVLKTMLVRPHAVPDMYEAEVRFYDEIRPELDIEAPRSFGAAFAGPTGHFGILLEDLSQRGAHFANVNETVSLDAIRSLLTELARLHAGFWCSPRLAGDLAWIPTPIAGGMAGFLTRHGYDFVQSQVDQHPFKQELIRPLGLSVRELWALLAGIREEQSRLPPTLLHGDTHLGNSYLLPGDGGGWLDWQLLTRGSFAHDVIYLLVTGLPTEVRRLHQRDLVAFYLDRLAAFGVVEPPSLDDAWLLCRKASLWGLVIGWLICPPENYGEAITRENIARAVAAVADLDVPGVARHPVNGA